MCPRMYVVLYVYTDTTWRTTRMIHTIYCKTYLHWQNKIIFVLVFWMCSYYKMFVGHSPSPKPNWRRHAYFIAITMCHQTKSSSKYTTFGIIQSYIRIIFVYTCCESISGSYSYKTNLKLIQIQVFLQWLHI